MILDAYKVSKFQSLFEKNMKAQEEHNTMKVTMKNLNYILIYLNHVLRMYVYIINMAGALKLKGSILTLNYCNLNQWSTQQPK